MAYFRAKNPNLGKFRSVLQWKRLVYYMAIGPILRLGIWYILWLSGIFFPFLVFCTKKKSGNPDQNNYYRSKSLRIESGSCEH
jgi:hypothetical protein